MSALPVHERFQAHIRRNEPMALHTSWRAGGPAEYFYTPHDRSELAAFLHELPREVPVLWIGLGSNLLVRDGGIEGVVICTHGVFTRLERIAEHQVYCEAGVPCAQLARRAGNWGLGQADFFAGIPGTFGGALAMNAGAYGGETWQHVRSVEVMDRGGATRHRAAGEYRPAYRHVQRPADDEWYLAAELHFERRTPEEAGAIRALAQRRRQTQPLGERSCGSVFTNPPGDHAARLIETAGLKGHRIGGAVVSDKHANFIINEGHATGGELERLIRHVQETVRRVHGVELVPEVRMVGREH